MTNKELESIIGEHGIVAYKQMIAVYELNGDRLLHTFNECLELVTTAQMASAVSGEKSIIHLNPDQAMALGFLAINGSCFFHHVVKEMAKTARAGKEARDEHA